MTRTPQRSVTIATWAIRLAALVVLVIAAHRGAAAQTTTVTTREGREYHGAVLREEGESLTLLTADSVQVTVPRSQIRTINYGRGPAPERMEATEPTDGPEKTSFPVVGGALGTPSGLNLVLGYYFNGWGVRGSGFYLGTMNGFEFEFLRNIGRSGSFSHNLHVGLGRSVIDRGDGFPDTWRYVEGGYDLNWGGFYLSTGLSAGSGSYTNPQLTFQIGYVHEFRQ